MRRQAIRLCHDSRRGTDRDLSGGTTNGLPLAITRKKKTLAVGIGLVLLGIVGIITWAVIVRVLHPDGTETVIKGADGTKVEVNGKDVTPKDENEKPSVARALSSLIGPEGKWKLPPGAPPPAVAPFDEKKAKEHQEIWAKYLGVPVEITNSIGMKLVLIPPGEFQMGSPKELIEEELKAVGIEKAYKDRLPSEAPQHLVRITKPFWLGTCEVTQEEYQRVMGTNPSEFSVTGKRKDKVGGQDTKRFPVENVSWEDAVEFCRKLSAMPEEKVAGRAYRLPSEAQWEYACRAGSTGQYSFSSRNNAIPKEFEGEGVARLWVVQSQFWRNDTPGPREAAQRVGAV